MSGKDGTLSVDDQHASPANGDAHTEMVRHVKVEEQDRQSGDTDDLPTHLVTRGSKTPIARLVVVGGAGAGTSRSVFAGTNSVGRETTNRISLDFGDDTISRKQHAVIVGDEVTGAMQVLDGGKVNPILVNGTVITGQTNLKIGDTLELGTTTLLVQAP